MNHYFQAGLNSGYNYDSDAVSEEWGLDCGVESMTQQQFKDECDINTIVARFGLTGQLPDDVRVPVSGDFTGVVDFQTAMNSVRAAEEAFMELPGALRARFANDPQRLMEFVSDDENMDEARKLGLLKPKVEVTRDAVMAIDELAARFPVDKP